MEYHPFPDRPITVGEVQRYIDHYGLDCSKDSRAILREVEDSFGFRVRIATLVLAALWSGFACVPHDGGRIFKFVQVE